MTNSLISNKGKTRGFTLLELIVAITIAGILLSVATPSFRESIQNNRLVTQINELNASISHARSEAIKRSANTAICKSSNSTSCAGDWEDGWIVFIDNDSDGAVDVGDEVFRVYSDIPGDNTLDFSLTNITFANNGFATAGANGTFTLCDGRGESYAKGLVIGPTGHPRVATDSDSNGIPEDASNTDLAC